MAETQDSIMTNEEIHQFVRNPPNREPAIKTSLNRLIVFDQGCGAYMKRHTEETKTVRAINKLGLQISVINTKFNEALAEGKDDIRIEHCLTDPPDDPKGRILRSSNGGYEFTKAGERACKKAMIEFHQKAMDREDIEITPYFVAQVPDDLTDEELEAFSGFVIRPEQAEAMRQEREEASAPFSGNGQPSTLE